jgi:hypothetical protein
MGFELSLYPIGKRTFWQSDRKREAKVAKRDFLWSFLSCKESNEKL